MWFAKNNNYSVLLVWICVAIFKTNNKQLRKKNDKAKKKYEKLEIIFFATVEFQNKEYKKLYIYPRKDFVVVLPKRQRRSIEKYFNINRSTEKKKNLERKEKKSQWMHFYGKNNVKKFHECYHLSVTFVYTIYI